VNRLLTARGKMISANQVSVIFQSIMQSKNIYWLPHYLGGCLKSRNPSDNYVKKIIKHKFLSFRREIGVVMAFSLI
jgi:hypothetical protein